MECPFFKFSEECLSVFSDKDEKELKFYFSCNCTHCKYYSNLYYTDWCDFYRERVVILPF